MAMPTQEMTVRRVVAVVDAGAAAPPVPGRLAPQVLSALSALVPCDSVCFIDIDPDKGAYYADDVLAAGELSSTTQPVVQPDDPFWRHYSSSLPCSYPTRTGDDRSVTLRSDFYSTREWKQTPMFVDVMRDVVFELMCPMPNVVRRSKRLLFFRSGATDFTEQDRFALALLRPHLLDMLRRGTTAAHASELTTRQQELMQLVADGRTNAEIAATLHLSPNTVRTHLMNIFERLGVTTRAAAVARVFAL